MQCLHTCPTCINFDSKFAVFSKRWVLTIIIQSLFKTTIVFHSCIKMLLKKLIRYFLPCRYSCSSTPNPCIADNFLCLTEDGRRCTILYCNQLPKKNTVKEVRQMPPLAPQYEYEFNGDWHWDPCTNIFYGSPNRQASTIGARNISLSKFKHLKIQSICLLEQSLSRANTKNYSQILSYMTIVRYVRQFKQQTVNQQYTISLLSKRKLVVQKNINGKSP